MTGNRCSHRVAVSRTLRRASSAFGALVALVGLGVAAGVPAGGTPAATAASPASTTVGPVVPYGAPIKAAVTPNGTRSFGTIVLAGSTVRSYQLYVPQSLPRRTAVPLLVALHGGLGSGSQFEQNSGFDGLAEANRFIVVYPNGTPIRRAARTGSSGTVAAAARSPPRTRTTSMTSGSSRP